MIAVRRWEKLTGKGLSDFENASAQAAKLGKGVATGDMMHWLYVAIAEGEEQEGRTFDLTLEDLSRITRPGHLAQFAPMFIEMYMGAAPEPTAEKQKKKKAMPLILWLRKELPSRKSRALFWGIFTGINAAMIWLILRAFGVL